VPVRQPNKEEDPAGGGSWRSRHDGPFLFYVGAGLLLTLLSLPLLAQKIGPNPWYGFRVRRTLEDPAIWYPANAFAAVGLLCVGLITSIAAIVLYLVPGITVDVYAIAEAAVCLGGLAVTVVMSFRYLGTLSGRGSTE
jgi:uncharacterized membrane protein